VRSAFIAALSDLADADPDVILMTGDLGFGVLDDFRARFPKQFLNVGVAEQNLAGVAAGLALTGHTVFTYSIGNFPLLRCLEQVRNDICYHGASVKIVSVGGGMAYGALGPSHFATEDIAIARTMPGMTVVAPGDPIEVGQLVPQVADLPGPAYLRLGRAGEPTVHGNAARIVLGRPATIRNGRDVLLLSTGGILSVVLEAAELLEAEGLSVRVTSVHTLSPFDRESVCEMAQGVGLVVTCEEHCRVGGLGGAVAEILMEENVTTQFRRFALPRAFCQGVGSQEFMRRHNGLDAQALHQVVLETTAVSVPPDRALGPGKFTGPPPRGGGALRT